MKRLKIYSLSACSLLFATIFGLLACATGAAASTFDESIFRSKIIRELSAEDLPGQCAVILVNRKRHRYDFGISTLETDYAVKILTREGIEMFGDFIGLPHNTKVWKYKIKAAVYSPNGKKKETGGSDKIKVAMGKYILQYRIAFPGLEVGSIIYIHQKVESKVPIRAGIWNFADQVPTLASELVFEVPKGVDVDFYFTPENSGPQPEPVTVDEKFDSYIIRLENLPPFKKEPFMPANNTNNPSLSYSIWEINADDLLRYLGITGNDRERIMTEFNKQKRKYAFYTSWSEIGKTYAKYFDTSSWDEFDGAEKNRKAANNFTREHGIEKVEDFVRDINKVKKAFHEKYKIISGSGYCNEYGSNPEEIFTLGEGTPIQLAYAFKMILSKMHIFASPVLVKDITQGPLDQRVPTYSFGDALLLVETGGEQFWIAPSCAECGVNEIPWEKQGVKGLLVRARDKLSFIITPASSAKMNYLRTRDEVSIKATGEVAGEAHITLAGQYFVELRRKAGLYRFGENVESLGAHLRDWLPYAFDGGELSIQSESRDSLVLAYKYSMHNATKRTREFLNVNLSPWFYEPVSEAFRYDKRRYDVVVPFPYTKEMTLEMELPENCSMMEKPQPAGMKSECFDFARECYTKGNKVIYKRRFIVKANRIGTNIYQVEKEFIDKMRQREGETIIIKIGM